MDRRKRSRTGGRQAIAETVSVPAHDIPEIRLGKYDVLPAISPEQYEALKESIRIGGVKVPVDLGWDGSAIDGEGRVRACRELGITDYPVIIRLGLTEEEERDLRLILNCQRRQFSQAEVRQLIRGELVREPNRCNYWIADTCGSTAPTVRRHRIALEAEGVIPAVEWVLSRDGTRQPARKSRRPTQEAPRPTVVVPTAEAVPCVLRDASQLETCDLPGRLHSADEFARIATAHRQQRDQRVRQIAGEGDGVDHRQDTTSGDDGPDKRHIDLMLADATVAGGPTYAELAEFASLALMPGKPLAVRVPTAEVAEAIRILGGPLDYAWTLVEVLPNENPVALTIPVDQRHLLTLLLLQPYPSSEAPHRLPPVADLIVPDGVYDPLAIVERLVEAYTEPGDTILDVQGRAGVADTCERLRRHCTDDPELPQVCTEPRHLVLEPVAAEVASAAAAGR